MQRATTKKDAWTAKRCYPVSMADFPDEMQEGRFERQEDAFRGWVGRDGGPPVEAGRYHLYISLACPWAHRTLIVRSLLGLQEMIGVSVADPMRDERGWAFREGNGHHPDEAEGFEFLSEAYHASDPDFHGRYTVPVLWDKKVRRIVNNSEDDICRMFQECFAGAEARDLFPLHLAEEQAALSDYLYEKVNNGVYRAGFATDQAAYEKAVRDLFLALDEMAVRLERSTFLLGEHMVESDLRLFCTLIRFDSVYHGHFKCNLRRIIDWPPLLRFMRDIYLQPGIAATVSFDHIKRHYYGTHRDLNPSGIVPLGPSAVFEKAGSTG
ncbi:glutathione S-transferase family protein [Luteolibacter flavescens]|uniref:Glutathione S-transferase family protein n=1 Tax=Luteolibacter flavescens TaxID=1859460 RepID=A0ABT3FJ36_9BACT|nr:glutathione S-transferase C-terminal domain-containing protein [Luteolibacter flavescens]MCW1883568.1 glutathione S-transferase family protein [Luteolibacter flavescens]